MVGENENLANQTIISQTATERQQTADTAAIEKELAYAITPASMKPASALCVTARSENNPTVTNTIYMAIIFSDRAANNATLGLPSDQNFRAELAAILDQIFSLKPTAEGSAVRRFFQNFPVNGDAAAKKTYVDDADNFKYDSVDHMIYIMGVIKRIACCFITNGVVYEAMDFVMDSVNLIPRHAWDAIYRSILGAATAYQVKTRDDFLKSYVLANFTNRRDYLHKAIAESQSKSNNTPSPRANRTSAGSRIRGRGADDTNAQRAPSNNANKGRGNNQNNNSTNANNTTANNNNNANVVAAGAVPAGARPILFQAKGANWIARMNKAYDSTKTGKVCEACIFNGLGFVYTHNTDQCSKCDRTPPFAKK